MIMNQVVAETLYGEDLYKIPGSVMIILSKSWDNITQEEKNQLSKILGAVKLNVESVQIITLQKITYDSFLHFSPSRIISFGVPFQPEIKPYEAIQTDKLVMIYADSLDSLDDPKKRNLWLALKVMFSV